MSVGCHTNLLWAEIFSSEYSLDISPPDANSEPCRPECLCCHHASAEEEGCMLPLFVFVVSSPSSTPEAERCNPPP
ncbi:hypothetical protein JZ751_005064 [Albula glossodonta]|uniref:Uncharacterized protein n=1 Tax=Albula glossodonta TaxID=121402 RepID=A0A8T2PFE4_9TELE|nr:hypothetical protein JZ751_005064 [Albula glossodonta]